MLELTSVAVWSSRSVRSSLSLGLLIFFNFSHLPSADPSPGMNPTGIFTGEILASEDWSRVPSRYAPASSFCCVFSIRISLVMFYSQILGYFELCLWINLTQIRLVTSKLKLVEFVGKNGQ